MEPELSLAPKLKPNHTYGRIVELIGFGRYSVLLSGAARPVPKERRDLVSRVKENDTQAAVDPIVPPPTSPNPPVGTVEPVDVQGDHEVQHLLTRPVRERKLTVHRLQAEGFVALAQQAPPLDLRLQRVTATKTLLHPWLINLRVDRGSCSQP